MKKSVYYIGGVLAMLTLFLSLQPTLLFAALVDTADDADSLAVGAELRANTQFTKRDLSKEESPRGLDFTDLTHRFGRQATYEHVRIGSARDTHISRASSLLSFIRGPPIRTAS